MSIRTLSGIAGLAAFCLGAAARLLQVSPDGTGDCIRAPCDLATALGTAQPNDELELSSRLPHKADVGCVPTEHP